jgi:hypothetical protein
MGFVSMYLNPAGVIYRLFSGHAIMARTNSGIWVAAMGMAILRSFPTAAENV